jgi:hypothetical protein
MIVKVPGGRNDDFRFVILDYNHLLQAKVLDALIDELWLIISNN